MKKILSLVVICMVTSLASILPASAQNSDKTDEYKTLLKKIMTLSGSSASSEAIMSQFMSSMQRDLSNKMRLIGKILQQSGHRRLKIKWWKYMLLFTNSIWHWMNWKSSCFLRISCRQEAWGDCICCCEWINADDTATVNGNGTRDHAADSEKHECCWE